MANQYHLAQVNIARMLYPIDDPQMADFVNNLDPINALADNAPGFVWRLQTDEGNATSIQPYEDEMIILNMSVWEDIESLKAYVFKSEHVQFVRRRKEWFELFKSTYTALWWVPAGHIPTLQEAKERLAYLDENGETPYAFTFKKTFLPESVNES